ncbi:MAG: transposase [Polyangiaceae bacterium]|nr:transposase [Polyangiaceae bacterium]
MRTLEADGRLDDGAVSVNTVRRFLVEQGLDAAARRHEAKGVARRRWAKAKPGALWHADVCHGPNLHIDGKSVPTRVLGILDDASRFIIGLRVFRREREVDMLALFVEALRTHGRCKTLYLDNGSTFRGDILRVACGRLGIRLVHAQPYDPQARGKMERFWKTLRQGCLDHVGGCGSLHDVQARLLAFLEQVYLPQPHGALFGKCPAEAYYAEGQREHAEVEEDELRDALTVRQTRRVARDGTVQVGGVDWEVDAGYLAGSKVTVGRTLLEPREPPWIEHEGQRHGLRLVDPVANAETPRKRTRRARGVDVIPFDPAGALLDRSLGRTGKEGSR